MYEEFHVADRWSGEDLHCRWKGTMVAIATRHADAVDVRYDVNGRPMWIALPCLAWVEQKKRTGKVITDQLAAQIAGRYLKQLIEEGYDSRREVYTMTVPEVLVHLDAVVDEAKQLGGMPILPVGPPLLTDAAREALAKSASSDSLINSTAASFPRVG
jgi:hypothetical protein